MQVKVQNAFEMVRPISEAGPSTKPVRKGVGQPPLRLSGSPRLIDARGRLRPMDTPANFGFFIEPKEQYQANLDKRRALSKARL